MRGSLSFPDVFRVDAQEVTHCQQGGLQIVEIAPIKISVTRGRSNLCLPGFPRSQNRPEPQTQAQAQAWTRTSENIGKHCVRFLGSNIIQDNFGIMMLFSVFLPDRKGGGPNAEVLQPSEGVEMLFRV